MAMQRLIVRGVQIRKDQAVDGQGQLLKREW